MLCALCYYLLKRPEKNRTTKASLHPPLASLPSAFLHTMPVDDIFPSKPVSTSQALLRSRPAWDMSTWRSVGLQSTDSPISSPNQLCSSQPSQGLQPSQGPHLCKVPLALKRGLSGRSFPDPEYHRAPCLLASGFCLLLHTPKCALACSPLNFSDKLTTDYQLGNLGKASLLPCTSIILSAKWI